jgi:cell division protein FtsI (penicillin-binding protein 3)
MRPYTVHKQKKQPRLRIIAVVVVFILLAASGGILYRLPVSLQDISRIFQSAAGNFFSSSPQVVRRIQTAEPLRGTIYDRHFREMAVSYSLYSLYAYPARIDDHQKVAGLLAPILHQSAGELTQRLVQSYRVVRIADNLDRKQIAAITELGLEGVSCRRSEARFYPGNTSAAHVLGYASDGVGLAGVEKRYDIVLQPGGYGPEDLPEVDLPRKDTIGRLGSDLVLTIDMDIQKVLDQYVQDLLDQEDGGRSMAIILDPDNGSILAATGLPAFNPNYFWQAGAEARCNGLVQPLFSFQSLRPLLVRAAARLRQGEVDAPLLPETVAAGDYGLKPSELDDALSRMAIFEPVSDPLRGDGKGEEHTLFESGERLSLLQIGAAMASLVNGGWRHNPTVLDSVYDLEHKQRFFTRKDASPPDHILSPAMGVLLRHDLLRPDAKKGKQKQKDNFFYVYDGARVHERETVSEYSREQILIGMGPRKKPHLLVVLGLRHDHLLPDTSTLDRKKLIRSGRQLLAGIESLQARAKEVIASHPNKKNTQNFSRFLIARRMEYTPKEREQLARGQDMPSLIGMSLRKGMRHLNGRNLLVEVEGSGRIVAQVPAPGASLAKVKVCHLTLDSKI